MGIISAILNTVPPTAAVIAVAIIGKIITKSVEKKLDSTEKTNRKIDFVCDMLKKDHEAKEDLKKQITKLTYDLKGFRKDEEKVRKD